MFVNGVQVGVLSEAGGFMYSGDGHVSYHVRVDGYIEWIEKHAILSTLSGATKNTRLLVLFAREHRDRRSITEASHDDFVGDHVHLQLLFALDILSSMGTENAVKPGTPNLIRNGLSGQRDRRENPREIPLRPRVPGFL